MGHLGQTGMQKLASVVGFKYVKPDELCDPCLEGKATYLSHKSSGEKKTSRPLELIHSDVSGTYQINGVTGAWYFVVFIDDHTRYCEVRLLSKKSEVAGEFKNFINNAERKLGVKAVEVRTVHGGEYMSTQFENWLEKNRIKHTFSIPGESEMMGTAERMIRTLRDRAKAMLMLFHANLPLEFWDIAVLAACYVTNFVPQSRDNDNPYKKWHKRQPDYSRLRVFGCKVHYIIRPSQRGSGGKIEKNTHRGNFIGYSGKSKAYKIWDNGAIVEAYSVYFDEKVFPGIELCHSDSGYTPPAAGMGGRGSCNIPSSTVNDSSDDSSLNDDSESESGEDTDMVTGDSPGESMDIDVESSAEQMAIDEVFSTELVPRNNETAVMNGDSSSDSGEESDRLYQGEESVSESSNEEEDRMIEDNSEHENVNERLIEGPSDEFGEIEVSQTSTDVELYNKYREGRLTRKQFMDALGEDDLQLVRNPVGIVERKVTRTYDERDSDDSSEGEDDDRLRGAASKRQVTDDNNTLPAPEERKLITDGNDNNNVVLLTADGDPSTWKEAMKTPEAMEWKKAADAEMKALMDRETWELVDLPKGVKAIGSKWVFKTKRKANGKVDKRKGRLCAVGCSQREGIDYNATFAPVVSLASARNFMAVSVHKGAEIHQMDVDSACLNGSLKETIYMRQPPGYAKPGEEDKVCKLRLPLYGLKQSPLCWNKRINEELTKLGFKRNRAGPCIYVKGEGSSWVGLALYVDDLLISSTETKELYNVKNKLKTIFQMKDLQHVESFLGLNVERTENDYKVNQEGYIKETLSMFDMSDCNAAKVPLPPSWDLVNNVGEPVDITLYQSLIGKLLYAANGTRPDISFAVSKLARYFTGPRETHMTAAKHVLSYLKGKIRGGIEYTKGDIFNVVGYSDASYGDNEEDRKSTGGFVIMSVGGPVCWASKKQPTVSLSTTEAEYIALGDGVKEMLWLLQVLRDMNLDDYKKLIPVTMYEDNFGCIKLGENTTTQKRTKHIDIKHHFLREHVQSGTIKLEHIKTSKMIGDIMTKALPAVTFDTLTKEMNMLGLRHAARGSVAESMLLSNQEAALVAASLLW